MQVTSYRLTARNGRHIRMATRIILDDGKHFDFTEKLGKAEAIRQYERYTAMQHRHMMQQMLNAKGYRSQLTSQLTNDQLAQLLIHDQSRESVSV